MRANLFGWSGTPANDEVHVRLELVDQAGVAVRSFEGSGTLSGGCCKSLRLTLSEDGETLIAQ